MDAVPLKTTYDVQLAWVWMLMDEFAPGGFIADNDPAFQRKHLLFALGMLRAVESRTGRIETGVQTIAERLGYNTQDHPGTETRRKLVELGFVMDTGRKNGRAPILRLCAPREVLEQKRYENLRDSALETVREPGSYARQKVTPIHAESA